MFESVYKYNYLNQSYVSCDSTDLLETGGWVDTKSLIKEIMIAGEKLQSFDNVYDYDEDGDLDDGFIDPTRSGNYDMADASEEMRRFERKSNDFKKAQNQKSNVPFREEKKEEALPPEDKKSE